MSWVLVYVRHHIKSLSLNTIKQMFSFPGAYPSSERRPLLPSTGQTAPSVVSTVLDRENGAVFTQKHNASRKTNYQHHLFGQLETLVYVLAGYQFVKYCHSAALVPFFLHVSRQKLLCIDAVAQHQSTNRMGLAGVIFSGAGTNSEEQAVRDNMVRLVKKKLCLSLYWKTLFSLLYHTLFVCTWAVLIVNDGNLRRLQYGTWWFISFIGEETPALTSHDSFSTKILTLGLPELLASDLVILFIQLILYQCIYRQSTVAGNTGDDEIFVVRAVGESGPQIEMKGEVPCVLKVKLYDSMKGEAFLE